MLDNITPEIVIAALNETRSHRWTRFTGFLAGAYGVFL